MGLVINLSRLILVGMVEQDRRAPLGLLDRPDRPVLQDPPAKQDR